MPACWAIDLEGQCVVTHTSPLDGRYVHVDVVLAAGEVLAAELSITVPLSSSSPQPSASQGR